MDKKILGILCIILLVNISLVEASWSIWRKELQDEQDFILEEFRDEREICDGDIECIDETKIYYSELLRNAREFYIYYIFGIPIYKKTINSMECDDKRIVRWSQGYSPC